MDWLVVAAFGTLVGLAELINRYRDAPVRSLWKPLVGHMTQLAVAERAAEPVALG